MLSESVFIVGVICDRGEKLLLDLLCLLLLWDTVREEGEGTWWGHVTVRDQSAVIREVGLAKEIVLVKW